MSVHVSRETSGRVLALPKEVRVNDRDKGGGHQGDHHDPETDFTQKDAKNADCSGAHERPFSQLMGLCPYRVAAERPRGADADKEISLGFAN